MMDIESLRAALNAYAREGVRPDRNARDVGAFVLRRALHEAKRWPDLYIAVNLSPLQVRDRTIVGGLLHCRPRRRHLAASISELREMADGRNDVLAEAAGITAGSWFASQATHVGHELIASGMLLSET